MTNTLGLDISHFSGAWTPSHLPPDVRFVLAKCTEGIHFVDPRYAMYRDQLPTGLRWGAWHVYRAEYPPLLQARHFRSHAHLRPGDVAALDLETKHAKALVAAVGTEIARRRLELWLIDVAREGCHPLVYVSLRGLKALTRGWREPIGELARYPLWLCQYVTLANWRPKRMVRGPVKPPYPTDWFLWQYTSSGRGKNYGFASSRMDLDLLNGGIERWDEIAVRQKIDPLPA